MNFISLIHRAKLVENFSICNDFKQSWALSIDQINISYQKISEALHKTTKIISGSVRAAKTSMSILFRIEYLAKRQHQYCGISRRRCQLYNCILQLVGFARYATKLDPTQRK